jgi:hypothetical protein
MVQTRGMTGGRVLIGESDALYRVRRQTRGMTGGRVLIGESDALYRVRR